MCRLILSLLILSLLILSRNVTKIYCSKPASNTFGYMDYHELKLGYRISGLFIVCSSLLVSFFRLWVLFNGISLLV